MLDRARERARALLRRARRFERRELREFRAWLEHTRNLLHLSILVIVPLLIAFVTWLSNAVEILPFLLFPPLASGTYTLFAQPESRYASPRRFVGGLTAGGLCGWIAFEGVTRYWQAGQTAGSTVDPAAAAFGIFLTGLVTWALDVEEASAFSSALLVFVVDVSGGAYLLPVVPGVAVTVTPQFAYVLSVLVSSSIVAVIFYAWRERFYERRARYLYRSTKGDDHVLVPMRGEFQDATAMLGARLAAAHEAGKVVLQGCVADEDVAEASRSLLAAERDVAAVLEAGPDGAPAAGDEAHSQDATDVAPSADDVSVDDVPLEEMPEEMTPGDVTDLPTADDADEADEGELAALAGQRAAAELAMRLETEADRIATKVGVPCEVVVAVEGDGLARSLLQTAHETNCDLIVVPYEEAYGGLAPYIRDLFRGDTDVLVHRATGRTGWRGVLVPVRKAGDTAHAMLDFARRLAGATGHVAVCHCIGSRDRRREAEEMLAALVETVDGHVETRVPRQGIESFLADHADSYDLVVIGASQDRSTASRFVSPPTFERIQDLECDVAIVDRNFRDE